MESASSSPSNHHSPFQNRYSRWFWVGLSILLIPINILIMLYMFDLIAVPGIEPVRDWQRGLWLSQYLGLLCCAVVLTDFKYPDLNGIYAFTFLFPHIAFFQSFGNIFTILNHFPHFLGWWVLFNPRIKFSRRGIYWGFGFVMVWLLLCFVLQYPTGMGANANNISDALFPAILLGGLIWTGVVDTFWRRKERLLLMTHNIPKEQWDPHLCQFLPRMKPIPSINGLNPGLRKGIRSTGMICILTLVIGFIFESLQRGPLSLLWTAPLFLLLTALGWVAYPRLPFFRAVLPAVLAALVVESFMRFSAHDNWVMIPMIVFCVFLFSYKFVIPPVIRPTLWIKDPVGYGAGFFIQGILLLLTASLSYHAGAMELNINFVASSAPLFLLLLSTGILIVLSFKKSRIP